MADPQLRRFELDELVNRPGTYFNPQTEVLVVVDDSPAVDSELLESEEVEGAEWVLVSDDHPIDEHARDELLEQFAIAHRADDRTPNEDVEDEPDDLEPDPDEA